MLFYLINELTEIKPDRAQRLGRPSSIVVNEYKELQTWIGNKYLNHGNNMAHTLSLVRNQINKIRDAKVFTEDGRSLNLFFSRGLHFAKRCSELYKKPNSTTKKVISKKLQLYVSPTLYLYDKNLINNLIKEKKCVLYDKQIPSYNHNKKVNTFEYRIKHAKDLPSPKYIITGKSFIALKKKDRIDYLNYAKMVEKAFPETILIHVTHISFGVTKQRNSTANEKHPLTGKRLLEILYNLEQGKYSKQRVTL